ncbi:MAG TPA: hypothetical protein VMR81_01485 [Patescibacteria group bacterium]|nr:hypothetical protein [Patescibacteria group bacterium]
MKVPYAKLAYVPREKPKDKIENYLLSLANPHSRPRALFFRSKGFSEANMNLFERRLLQIIQRNDVTNTEHSQYGEKYIVDGVIETPIENSISLRTMWIVDNRKRKPKFVTAFPHRV